MITLKKFFWTKAALYVLFWLLFGFYFTSELYINYSYSSEPYSFYFLMLLIMPEAFIWIFLCLGIIKLTTIFPLSNKPWYRNLSIHLMFGVIFAVVHSILHAYLAGLIGACQEMPYFAGRPFDFMEHFIFNLVIRFHRNFIIYFTVVAVIEGIHYYKKFREGELQASKLETQLTAAKLQALKLQLQPHFLFNTMHTISSLIHEQPDIAQKMIVRLSELLRLTLNSSDHQLHTLNDEIKILEKYLEIEQIRFEDKLTVRINIDPETNYLKVPTLILQPIVENAIKHGIEKCSGPGVVEISSFRKNGTLIFHIQNSGETFNYESSVGIGISSAQSRLKYLYGDRSSFQLTNINGVCLAELCIPV